MRRTLLTQSELPLRIELTYGWVLFLWRGWKILRFLENIAAQGKANENFLENLPLTYTYYVYVGLVFLKLQKIFFEICTNFFRAVVAKVYISAYTGDL